MADVYEQRSYAQVPIGFGHRPGIVVVDYQVGFTDPQYALGGAPLVQRGVDRELPAAVRMLTRFRGRALADVRAT